MPGLNLYLYLYENHTAAPTHQTMLYDHTEPSGMGVEEFLFCSLSAMAHAIRPRLTIVDGS